MRIKFDTSIQYVRVNNVEEMDFENLPPEHLRQFARGIVRLLGKNLKDANISQVEDFDELDLGSRIEAGNRDAGNIPTPLR